jgi:hypothetical protein
MKDTTTEDTGRLFVPEPQPRGDPWSSPREKRVQAWETGPALALLVGFLAWAVPALWDHRVLDLGMAYNGGAEAWRSGHPERLHTWMSTPFLAMVMACVSRVMSMRAAEWMLTRVNLVVLVCTLVAVWRRLRPHVPRAWWWATLALAACFPPLISTVRWKQFNLLALAIAVLAMQVIRKGRPALGGSLVGLSVCLKPVILLLPLGLLLYRDSRRSGLWSLAAIACLMTLSQGFLAARAGDPGDMSPITALSNFGEKSEEWVPHVGNFSPLGLLARGAGVLGVLPWERFVLRLAVALLSFAAYLVTRSRGGASWDVLGFACLLSPMLSPVAWSHYQILLAPLLLVLAYRFLKEGAWPSDWALLIFSYGLSALAMTPLVTVPGGLSSVFGGGYETIERQVPVLAISQFAQYFLVLTALAWHPRSPSAGLGSRVGPRG